LVRHHLFGGAFAVRNMLVDIDDRLGDGLFAGGEKIRPREGGGP